MRRTRPPGSEFRGRAAHLDALPIEILLDFGFAGRCLEFAILAGNGLHHPADPNSDADPDDIDARAVRSPKALERS